MKGRAALSRRQVRFTARDLFKEPLDAAEIRGLARLHPDGVRGLLSTRTAQFKALGFDRKLPGDAELVSAMAREPRLIRRPLLVDGKRVIVGFDREAYEHLGR